MASWLGRVFGDGKGGGKARGELVRRYDAYLQVLRTNADAVELISELEALQAEGGVCGRRRFRAAVTRLGIQVYSMARMLRVLGGERYDPLLPAIDRIRHSLEEALKEEAPEAPGSPLVMPLSKVAQEALEAFGGKATNLARLQAAGGVAVPQGFAVSLEGFRHFLRHNGLPEKIRLLFDSADPGEPVHLAEAAERLRGAVLEGSLPPDLSDALREASSTLAGSLPPGARFAVRSSATGEDGAVSFAGQYSSVLDVPEGEIPSAYLRVLAGFFNAGAVLMRLRRGYGALELGMGALVLRMIEPRVSGVVYSRDPTDPDGNTVLVEAVAGRGEALVGGTAVPAAWTLDRAQLQPVRRDTSGGHPPISEAEIAAVARLALKAEEVLRCAADVEWALDGEGKLWLLQARPLAQAPAVSEEAGAPFPGHVVLAEGGVCASPGAGFGSVAKVRGRDDALLLPEGSVMVAVEALPDLALALPRAAAVVAARGGVTGHLASIARELGVPALFGLEPAFGALDEGAWITVDATGRRIYEGEVREALERRGSRAPARGGGGLAPLMERTLPLILPLTLRDPASELFAPERCETLHDVVRYIHEKALAETVGVGDAANGRGGAWYRVDEPLPFDLRLVSLEGGLEAPAGTRTVKAAQVTSAPARALLAGMLDPAVRRKSPPALDAAGFMSVLSASAAGQDADLGGATWALVSDRYLQLSSRIGYHFTTLEAFAGGREQDNRVRFIFKGGAADDGRRMRRARFIARVLEGLGFQVALKGDFVSGTFGHAPSETVGRILEDLGRLLVCANRLDMILSGDELAAWYADAFLRGDFECVLQGKRPEDGGPATPRRPPP